MAVMQALSAPTASVPTTNDGRTWVHPFLSELGFSAETLALCEEKLVQQECIITMKMFARIPLHDLNRAYLEKIDITAMGVQQALLDLHEQCVVAARQLNPALHHSIRDKMTPAMAKIVLKDEQKRYEKTFDAITCVVLLLLLVLASGYMICFPPSVIFNR